MTLRVLLIDDDRRLFELLGDYLVPDPKWPIARGTLRQGFKRGPPGTANGPRRARQSLAGAGTLGFLGARTQRCIADLLSVTCRPVAHGWPT